jgi:hypothetical protein
MRRLLIVTFSACFAILGIPSDSLAQSKEEIHQFFEKQAATMDANRHQLSSSFVDVLQVQYDRKSSTLFFRYSVDLARTANKLSTSDERIAMKAILIQAACSGDLAPFIRSRNLRLNHIYYDKANARELSSYQISKSDC